MSITQTTRIPDESFTFDEDMTNPPKIEDAIEIAKMLTRDVYHDGFLLAHATTTMIRNYPPIMGKTYEEAAVEYILEYSKDGTLFSGIENLINEMNDPDYTAYVSFELSTRLVTRFNELNPTQK